LIYKLSHEYTKASLSFDFLKGSDGRIVQQLREASKGEDFSLYLAHIEKEILGSCEETGFYGSGYYAGYWDDLEDMDSDGTDSEDQKLSANKIRAQSHLETVTRSARVISKSLKLTRVIDKNGKEVAIDVELIVDDIAQGDIFKRAPDDEE
jgi:hypothetical protein